MRISVAIMEETEKAIFVNSISTTDNIDWTAYDLNRMVRFDSSTLGFEYLS